MESDQVPPHAYIQQLLRAYRFRDRYHALIASQSSVPGLDFNDLEDFLWATFQNIWHVKDWLYHDPSVKREVAHAAVKAAEAKQELLIAADMANGTKHFLLKNERVGAHDAAIQLVTNHDGTTSCHHEIRLTDGTRMRAIDAIDRAFDAWREILKNHGLYYLSDYPPAV
jgi:hypothetical protein